MLFSITVYSEPWYSIPLKQSSNNEHLITTMSFGSPIKFNLDIVMDSGSGRFHIYHNKHNNLSSNNIIPHETDSFQCICQSIAENSYLRQSNTTWYQYEYNSTNNTHTSLLPGCPIFNASTCSEWGEQCHLTDIYIYFDEQQQCDDDIDDEDITTSNASFSHTCPQQTCTTQQGGYGLLVNGETVSFRCGDQCYSGIDIISFKDIPNGNLVPYVYSDSIILDNKEHNISLFVNESWSDGTLGLIYDYNQQTSFWQILGIQESHSALLAFDILGSQLHIGNVSDIYLNDHLIEYSESIWFDVNYHFFYIYSLSICGVNLFEALDIGTHYLAMIDTGATCLTLPPEMFDLFFTFVPFGFECNAEQTFCYILSDITGDRLHDYKSFPMLSFKLSDDANGRIFYVSLMDLVIELQGAQGMNYCIERGQHSMSKIDECAPGRLKASECTSNGVIIFGTKVLNSLYTILDFPNIRVGFANNVISGYSEEMYESVNAELCPVVVTECAGDDVLNRTKNECQSGRDECEMYWGWTYDEETHSCVLHVWLCAIIPLVWIVVMGLLLVFVRFKMWIDHNVYYSAIKV